MGGAGGGSSNFGGKSQGTSGGGGGRGGGGSKDPCAEFKERTVLASPNPKVLKKLKPGDLLELTLTKGKPPICAIVPATKEVAGRVVPREIVTIVRCMESGHQFEAKVLKVDGGACTVEVRSKKMGAE